MISLERASYLLMSIFLLALFLDIGGQLFLKKIAFSSLIGLSIINSIKARSILFRYEDIYLVLIILMFGLYGLLNGSTLSNLYSQIGFLLYFLVAISLRSSGDHVLNIIHFFYQLSVALAITICVLFFLVALEILLPSQIGVLADYGLGYFGLRPNSNFVLPNIYFRHSVFCLVGLCIALERKSHLVAGICYCACLLTLSSALIVVSSAVICLHFIKFFKTNLATTFAFLFFVLWLAASFYLNPMIGILAKEFVISKFTSQSLSTGVKLGHIISALDVWSNSIHSMIFGTGFGVPFYTIGTNSWTVAIEPSYANLLRQSGLIGVFTFFAYWFVVLVKKPITENKTAHNHLLGLRKSIVLILIVASSNPILLSPMVFIPIFLYRAGVASVRKS